MLIEVNEQLSGETIEIPADLVILMVGMEAREDCGRGGAPREHQPRQGRLVHREPPQARPGRDHHRRRLHRRRLPGTQGHPRLAWPRHGPPRPGSWARSPRAARGGRRVRRGGRGSLLGVPRLQRPLPLRGHRVRREKQAQPRRSAPCARRAGPASPPARRRAIKGQAFHRRADLRRRSRGCSDERSNPRSSVSSATGAPTPAPTWPAPAGSTTRRNMRVIRVMCSARIDPTFVLKALLDGADGVLICGCHPGDCHYSEGNYKTMRRYPPAQEAARRLRHRGRAGAAGMGERQRRPALRRRRERHDRTHARAGPKPRQDGPRRPTWRRGETWPTRSCRSRSTGAPPAAAATSPCSTPMSSSSTWPRSPTSASGP